MKKFFITLLVLVLIAGALLFLGWAQLGIPPDGYGVIHSKTHGLYPHLVKPGEFKWIWYKLIPTNTRTTVIYLNPVNHEFNVKSALPSGKIFSTFAGIDNDFSWEIGAIISFNINPDAIIPLFSGNAINSPEDLANYEKTVASDIEDFIVQRFVQEEYSGQFEELLQNAENPQLEKDIQRQFPFLNNFSLRVKTSNFPDFALYKQVKNIFENYLAMQKEYISSSNNDKAKRRIDSMMRFDELELYGALLTKYPILLEFLALENKK